MKIKTGDLVRVISGKNKGKEGKVTQVFPLVERVVVDGVNALTRHLKGRGQQTGQKIQFHAPIHVSNVKLVSAKSGKQGRAGYKFIDQNGAKKKVRVIRKAGSVEDVE